MNFLSHLCLIFVCLLGACTPFREIQPEEIPDTFIETTVDNETVVMYQNQPYTSNFGGHENCNTLHFGGSYYPKVGKSFMLYLDVTKEGYIKRVTYVDAKDGSKNYNIADFDALETFQIRNFEYDQSKGEVYFEFEGTLFYGATPTSPTKYIKGKVQYKNLPSIACGFFPREFVSATPSPLLRITFGQARSNTDGTNAKYFNYTDNGYSMIIHCPQKLQNMPTGVYAYNTNTPFRITVQKYIGTPKYSTLYFRESEWISYDCEGEMSILQQVTGTFSHTVGKFSLRAKDENGNIVHNLPQVDFKIAHW